MHPVSRSAPHTLPGRFLVGALAVWLTLPAFAATFISGDVNSDASVDAIDVQLLVNGALGLATSGTTDIDYDVARSTTAIDVQLGINAALGIPIDSDGDGLCEAAEASLGTDSDKLDSDGDGLGDGQEVYFGTNPLASDLAAGAEGCAFLPGRMALEMARIPQGNFWMGRYAGEIGASSAESPQHEVTLTHPFWMGKYPVTKAQWQAVMGTTPWRYYENVLDHPNSPAVCLTWNDTQEFLATLNAATGKTFRLPTEAEWEYACRAGTTTRFYWGDDLALALVNDHAWWHGNAADVGEAYAHIVGQKLPNPWGLYDMAGNIWEWCQDWMGAYEAGAVVDPTGPAGGTQRVPRGGSWYNPWYQTLRSAYHGGMDPSGIYTDYGFRICTTDTL